MAGVISSLISGLSGGDDYYGRKPRDVPAPTIKGILDDVIGANTANAAGAANLAALTNKYNQENILNNLRSVLGTEAVDEMPKAIGRKLAAELKGELSPDMLASLRNFTAAQGLESGVGVESGRFANNLVTNWRDRAYEVSNRALSSYENWLASSSALLSPTFDLANMFASVPLAKEIASNAWDINNYQATIEAAPDPAKRGRFDSSMALVGMVLSAYGGGSGYTGKAQQPWEGGGGYGEAGSGEGSSGGFNFFGLGGRQGGAGGQWYMGNQVGQG